MLIIAVNVFIYFMISSSHFYTAVTLLFCEKM